LFVLVMLVAVALNQVKPGSVPPQEHGVLMELFAGTGGDSWSNRDGWGTEKSPCDWYGVWCDFLDGDASRPVVAGLSLSLNNLAGTLPASLGELQHLHSLTVSGNRLSGNVPEAILERWDRHQFEFDGRGNAFSNLVIRATVEYSASGALCSASEDLHYRVEFDEPKNRVTFQSVRCITTRSRNTYCLVRDLRKARFQNVPSAVRLPVWIRDTWRIPDDRCGVGRWLDHVSRDVLRSRPDRSLERSTTVFGLVIRSELAARVAETEMRSPEVTP
jgi:hypothetical protein